MNDFLISVYLSTFRRVQFVDVFIALFYLPKIIEVDVFRSIYETRKCDVLGGFMVTLKILSMELSVKPFRRVYYEDSY